jgi:hypothetical protein
MEVEKSENRMQAGKYSKGRITLWWCWKGKIGREAIYSGGDFEIITIIIIIIIIINYTCAVW